MTGDTAASFGSEGIVERGVAKPWPHMCGAIVCYAGAPSRPGGSGWSRALGQGESNQVKPLFMVYETGKTGANIGDLHNLHFLQILP